MKRVVLDTNVIVSSVLSKRGAPFRLMEAWRASRFILVTSKAIIQEVRRVLSEQRLKEMFHITEQQITRLVETLSLDAVVSYGNADASGAVPDDPSDEMFLAAALNGNASAVISGDKHLLNLGMFRGITILRPRQFLDQLEEESSRGEST
jgi:putative PIN family toxin of toxin-antitoxin system